jgi:hypothetical protein
MDDREKAGFVTKKTEEPLTKKRTKGIMETSETTYQNP